MFINEKNIEKMIINNIDRRLSNDPKAKVDFFQKLEDMDIHLVRARLENNYWKSNQNIAWAKEWIEEKERPEREKARQEELDIAREANKLSKLAIGISALAAVAAIIALFVKS